MGDPAEENDPPPESLRVFAEPPQHVNKKCDDYVTKFKKNSDQRASLAVSDRMRHGKPFPRCPSWMTMVEFNYGLMPLQRIPQSGPILIGQFDRFAIGGPPARRFGIDPYILVSHPQRLPRRRFQ